MVKLLVQKVENAKLVLGSQNTINIATDINFCEFKLGPMSNSHMHHLMIPPNKTINTINKELSVLCETTICPQDKRDKPLIFKHEFFKMLNGNPLCGLLVSSNATSMLKLNLP